jgi:hypothetical protein
VVIVRTNHGWFHENAGYQDGDDHLSTLIRRENAQRVLEDDITPEELAPALYNHEYRNPDFNIVRDAKLYTSSQMVCDLSRLIVRLYLVPGKQEFLGVVSKVKDPKIKFELFVFDRSGKPKSVNYEDLSKVPE